MNNYVKKHMHSMGCNGKTFTDRKKAAKLGYRKYKVAYHA